MCGRRAESPSWGALETAEVVQDRNKSCLSWAGPVAGTPGFPPHDPVRRGPRTPTRPAVRAPGSPVNMWFSWREPSDGSLRNRKIKFWLYRAPRQTRSLASAVRVLKGFGFGCHTWTGSFRPFKRKGRRRVSWSNRSGNCVSHSANIAKRCFRTMGCASWESCDKQG